jgi:hypothetical protein
MIIENKFKSVGNYLSIGNIWWLIPDRGAYVQLLEDEDIHDMCTTAIRHDYQVHIYAEHPIDVPVISDQVLDEEEEVNLSQSNVNVAVGEENLKDAEEDENLNEAEEVNVVEAEENLNEAEEVNVAEGDENVQEAEANVNEGDNVNETEDDSSEDDDYWPPTLSDDDDSFMNVECDLSDMEREEPGSSRNRQRKNKGISIDLDQNVDEDVGDNDSYHSEDPKTPVSSDDEYDSNGRQVFPQFDANAQFGQVHLEKAMEFETLKMFKQAVKDYTIYHMREIKWVKNDKSRYRAACVAENCGWEIFCSWSKLTNSFQVKTFSSTHDCPRGFVNKQATTKWVADKLEEKIKIQPNITYMEAYDYIKRSFGVQINETKLFRALKEAKTNVEGNYKEQYGLIWDYARELQRSNVGTTAKINVTPVLQGPPQFKRFYVCLDACKRGFKAGCRPFIGLDGCFLKGYYGGQLLTAVGTDANNQNFVIAYAIVDAENKDNWKWFLTLLHEDLGAIDSMGRILCVTCKRYVVQFNHNVDGLP